MQAPWLLDDERTAPESWMSLARARLAEGTLVVSGPSGSGKSALAWRLVAEHQGPRLAVRLAGCVDAADVYRAIGGALDLALPGSPNAISEALERVPETLVLLDEGEGPGPQDALSTLLGTTSTRFLLTTTEGGGLPSPLPAAEPPDVSDLAREADWLALLPAGLNVTLELPPEQLVRHPTRSILRRDLARGVLAQRSPDPRRVATEVLPLALPLFDVTLGRAPPRGASILRRCRPEGTCRRG